MGDLNTMSKKTILVVDDDDPTAILTEGIVEDDYNVIMLKSGEAALNFLIKKKVSPNLVLLDLYMPGMSGWNTLIKMHKLCRARNIPIVMYTASEDDEDIERAKAFGAAGYIHKPSNRDTLLGEVANLVN
jgi:CheY-like chemotaxis protein